MKLLNLVISSLFICNIVIGQGIYPNQLAPAPDSNMILKSKGTLSNAFDYVKFKDSNPADSTSINEGFGTFVYEVTPNNYIVEADSNQLVTPYDLSLVDQNNTNELQTIDTFRINSNILELSLLNDGQAKKTVDLSSYVNVAESDPVFAADSSKIIHFADTLVNIASQYDLQKMVADSSYWTKTGNNLYNQNTGNVGIGTSSPIQKFEVNGRAKVDQFTYNRAINISFSDLDDLVVAGFYCGIGLVNAPNSGWFYVEVQKYDGDNNWAHQIATSFGSANIANIIYSRTKTYGTWGLWKDISELQNLSKSKTGNNVTINISNGTGTTFSVADADSLTTNEIQTLSIDSLNRVFTLSLTNGGSVKFKDVDTQLSESQVDNYVSNNGYLTSEVDGSTSNEIQTLTADSTSTTIGITSSINNSRVHFSVLKSEVDGSISNEIQKIDTFEIYDTNKLRISLQNDNEIYKTVTLPALSDTQDLSIDSLNRVFTISLTDGGSIKFKDSNSADSTIINDGYGIYAYESTTNTWNVEVDTVNHIPTLWDLAQMKIDSFYLMTNGQLRLKQHGYATNVISSMLYGGSSLGANYLPIWASGQNLTNYWGYGTLKVTNGLLSTYWWKDIDTLNVSDGLVKATGKKLNSITDNSANWNTAYNKKINSLAFSGTTTKTLTLTQQDGSTISNTFTDNNSGGTVTQIVATSPLTGGTITSSGTIGIQTASGSQSGAISSTDWTTFNNKPSGSGTQNYLSKWNNAGGTQLGNSLIYDNGTNIGIGTTSSLTEKLNVDGAINLFTNYIKTTQTGISDVWYRNTGIQIKNIYVGAGAWAREFMKYTNSADVTYFGLGAVGIGQTGYYGYLGDQYYGAALKISTPNTIDAVNRIGINVPIDTRPQYTLDVRGTPGFFNAGIYGTLDDALFFGNLNNISGYRNKIQSSISATPAESKLCFSLSTGASTYADVLYLQGDGKVGINTTSPTNTLHVAGSAKITDLATGYNRLVYSGSTGVLYNTSGTGYLKGNGTSFTYDNSTFIDNSLTSGYVIVGNAGNIAAKVAMSGDATISNTGTVEVANDSHLHNSSSITTDIVSSVEGVANDGGNIDLIGDGISITGDNTNDNITFTIGQKVLKAYASDTTNCSSAWRKVKLNTSSINNGGYTLNGTNYTIQFPSTGVYEIETRIAFVMHTPATDQSLSSRILINGSEISSDIASSYYIGANTDLEMYSYKTFVQITNTSHLLTCEVRNNTNNNQFMSTTNNPTIMIKKISN